MHKYKYIIYGVIAVLLTFCIPIALNGFSNAEKQQTYNIPDKPVDFDKIFGVAEQEKEVDLSYEGFSILSTQNEELSFNEFGKSNSTEFNFGNDLNNDILNNLPTQEQLSNLLTFGEKNEEKSEPIENAKSKVTISGVYSDKQKENETVAKTEETSKNTKSENSNQKKQETKKEVKKEETKTETTKKVEIKQGTPVNANDSELDMLAKIIWAEARGEPYEGKLAVGAVVLNRVKSPKFPNTIKDVIYAPNQFSPVSSGQFAKAKPGEEEYRAAREALEGKDPTNEALYFYAPNLTANRWHETLTHTVTIGNHKFFK